MPAPADGGREPGHGLDPARHPPAPRRGGGGAPATGWTGNAIGERAGAWGLAEDSPEATRGFLLNHVISEWLPAQEGFRQANSDPVTGQAAWYDLRVRIERALPEEAGLTDPHPAALRAPPPPPERPAVLRYNANPRAGGGGRAGRRAP